MNKIVYIVVNYGVIQGVYTSREEAEARFKYILDVSREYFEPGRNYIVTHKVISEVEE